MNVLILDNYDSFTYNLYHYVQYFTDDITVLRNDELSVEEAGKFSHILISPGPGLPSDAGICMDIIEHYHDKKSILGVCLGCQALGEFYGASIFNQQEVAHGIEREVIRTEEESWLLNGLPDSFKAGLYHSWAVDPKNLSEKIKVTASTQKGILMAMEHTEFPVAGVQFHPESIMSEHGLKIIENWINY